MTPLFPHRSPLLRLAVLAGALGLLPGAAPRAQTALAPAPESAPASLAGTQADTPAPPLTAAHRQALREVLVYYRLPQSERADLAKMAGEAELQTAFLAQLSDENIIVMLMPVYAQYLSQAHAVELASALRGPGMRKTRQYLGERDAGRAGAPPKLTAAEEAEVRRAARLPGLRLMKNAEIMIKADRRAMWVQARKVFSDEIWNQMFQALARNGQALRAAPERPGAELVTVEHSGMPYRDQLFDALLESMIKLHEANRRFSLAIAASGQDDVLLPANLVDPAAIARGHEVLNQVDALLEAYLSEADRIAGERGVALEQLAIAGRPNLSGMFDKSSAARITTQLKYGEMQRKILDIQRRILSLYAARAGKVQLKDGKAVFAAAADNRLAAMLATELGMARRALQELVARPTAL